MVGITAVVDIVNPNLPTIDSQNHTPVTDSQTPATHHALNLSQITVTGPGERSDTGDNPMCVPRPARDYLGDVFDSLLRPINDALHPVC